MKRTKILLSFAAATLVFLVPAFATESEFTYDEFEINDLPETQEEESAWEFSFGIEGVYGKGKTSVSQTYMVPGYWESDYIYHPREIKIKKVKLDMGGLNLRLNWKRESPFPETILFPEIFVLGGFMTGESEGRYFWMFQCAGGGNLHLQLSNYVSVFGGARVGLGYLLLDVDDASWASRYYSEEDSNKYATDFGVNYGIGAGIDFRLGERGGIVRLGVDYLASTTEAESGIGGLSISNPKWVIFSLSYNATF